MQALIERRFDLAQGRRIGLFGGAFNPPHSGHKLIASAAARSLNLDRVWWMLRSHYPHKPDHVVADTSVRRGLIANFTDSHPRMVTTTIEDEWLTRSTVGIVERLQIRRPNASFILVLGADQWADLHRWHNWEKLVSLLPIAVFCRPNYEFSALNSYAAIRLARFRHGSVSDLITAKPPAWRMYFNTKSPMSSSSLRNFERYQRGGN